MADQFLRGEIYYVELDPIVGSEQGGNRPALVVQNDVGNLHSPTIIIAPITSKKKPELPTHIYIDRGTGLRKGSVVLLEQLRTIDKARVGDFVCTLNKELLAKINRGLLISCGVINQDEEGLLMTLCKSCADSYRDSGNYRVYRIDYDKQIKEPCTLCTRPGFDYEVSQKCS